MNNKSVLTLVPSLIIFIGLVVGFVYLIPDLFEKESTIHDSTSTVMERGPHGGRFLQEDDFQVEVSIYEPEGVSPKFRIYFYDQGFPIPPSEVKYEMELQRINRLERIPFKQEDDYLESTIEASEPHSFKVKATAQYEGKAHSWEYASYEGRVDLTPESIKENNIKIERVGPINLEITLGVTGKIVPNEESTVYISPRFPGMVKTVNKKLGDLVHKGDVLAVIESNESLKNYEVKAELAGMIIKKNINVGMFLSGQENVFVISDLSTVWADFNIYRKDLPQVKIGQSIEITSLDRSVSEKSVIAFISPLGNETTQSVIARSILQNPQDVWKPGLFVSGEITIENETIPLAVKQGSLQTFRDWSVVFISVGDLFEVVPVQLGRSNREWIEIKSGLKPGDLYVSENSFILKADLEKSGAKHEH